MSGEPIMLVCTRLSDMTVMHPKQIQELCSKCQHVVGIYPTGQEMMKRYPKMKLVCVGCADLGAFGPDDEIIPAGTIDEIIQEKRDSVPSGKA
jgi:flavoprotein